jgi:glycosyltransferase involved in cell wall biosynthesis
VRILIVQRSLAPPGGGNAVAAWMVQALIGRHDVGTLTVSEWTPAQTNAFYGTAIPAGAVVQHRVAARWRWMTGLPEDRLARLQLASVYGASRALADRYDLMITAEYYAAFARPGIQYVQFPARLRPQPQWWPRIVNQYFAWCEWLLGAPWTDAALNRTLGNSQWTANGIAQLGELPNPSVLYPPVLDPGAALPWADRDDAFVCLGRFHPSKRIELAISIVRAVRAAAMPQARLLIVGSAVDAGYTARLRGLAADDPWIEFHEDLSRVQLDAVIGRSRYGLQAMVDEHFGMATAEMTRAGCLVFAHRSGGTPEVLNQEDALLWSTEDEALERIAAVAALPPPAADAMRHRLLEHAQIFSTQHFIEQFRAIVDAVR